MEKAIWLVVLALQFFSFFTEESLAIQCYRCAGGNCNDPFNPNLSGITKCEGKTCVKAKAYVSGKQFVQRDCLDDVIEKSSCKEKSESGMSGVGCSCDKELCNDSRKVGSFTGLFLFLSVASLAYLLKLH